MAGFTREAGLTLLEVLLAVALLSVFFASVYTLVWGTLRTRDAIEEEAVPYAVGPVVIDRVVQDLTHALVEPYKDGDAFRAETETLAGETVTRIDFVTTVDSRARLKVKDEWVKASINEVGYRLRRSETADGLLTLYRREDFGVDDEPLEGGRYHKLADRVKTFRIDFFAEDPGPPDADEAKGEESWDARKEKKLPWGCRVTLVLVGAAEEDDQGTVVREEEEYPFVAYVAFPRRFDKPDSQGAPGAPQNPGGPPNPGGR